ncbi:MAG: hypothetical protein ACI396_09560 [Acutalibacteraceae bacterium]
MKKTEKLLKITAAAFFAAAAVDIIMLISAIVIDVVSASGYIGYDYAQYLGFGQYILMLLQSAVIPIAYQVFVAVLSVMLAVWLLKNKNETLLLRIFCIGNAAYLVHLAIKNGLFNQITYIGEFFGNLNLMSVQRLVTAALLIAIAVLYSNTCGKRQANVLVILSAAQYLIYTAVSVVSVINVISLENMVTPIYSAVISIIAAVLAYLPLLLICIHKRILLARGDSTI